MRVQTLHGALERVNRARPSGVVTCVKHLIPGSYLFLLLQKRRARIENLLDKTIGDLKV